MSQIRKTEIEHIQQAIAHFHGVRALAAAVNIPAGTLSSASHGKRRLNAAHRRKLVNLGLLPAPKTPVPWKRVAFLVGSHLTMREAMAACGIDSERTERIVNEFYDWREAL